MSLLDHRVQLAGELQIDCHVSGFRSESEDGRSLRTTRLENYNAFGDADGAQVAVPAFDGVFLGVAVSTEQLHAVETDLHALVGAELLGQRGLAGERQALIGARRAAP